MSASLPALNALNFFMADVRDGLGPFFGVFLQDKGWAPDQIGLVMSIGGYAGMAAMTPLGMLADQTRAKRAIMVVAALAVIVANMALLFHPGFMVAAVSQVVTALAGAAIAPAIASITLGLVRQSGFARQLGRNEGFNHAGNATAAALGGLLGWLFGLEAVFYLMTGMAALSIVAVLMIAPAEIDHDAARGLSHSSQPEASSLKVLLRSRPLLILGATLALFHLGNAAMLPLLGQALVARGAGDPSAYTAATVIVAQATMIPMAFLAAWLAGKRGYWIVMVIALAALPVRGLIAATITGPWGLAPVQILDGVGAGLLGVATPGLVAIILAGSGRVNAGLGAVMTIQGLGAASSPAIAGYVAAHYGYSAAFMGLAAIALAGLLLWLLASPAIPGATGAPAAVKADAPA
jgi:predicted MFS family arabinose efflux permease